jgi:Family of unknown function (DUF6163)
MNKAQKPGGRVHMETEPIAAISIDGNYRQRTSAHWGLVLIWFMRLVSVVWLILALLQWDTIIRPDPYNFDVLPPIVVGVTVFFAVINPVAAVGLWLATQWGGVIWLIAAVAQACLALFMPELVTGGKFALIFDFALIVAYFLLTYKAAVERDL